MMRKSRLEKYRNMLLMIARFSAFLSSLYFFFRIRNYMIALNYKPLWIQLAKKGLKKTDVIAMAGLTTNVMAQMGKDKPITFKNLERICKALSCTPNDIISFEDNFSEEE